MLGSAAMMSSDTDVLAAVAAVHDGEEAARLLARSPGSATVRALALRADELRFERAAAAQEVAEAALGAFRDLPAGSQRPGVGCLLWAVYGSILRTRARFDEAEIALATAASLAPRCRPEARADLERRLAYLRADTGDARETMRLIERRLHAARSSSGQALGKELVNAGAMMMCIRDFRKAGRYLQKSLVLLPPNGNKHHLSAIANLASCRLEVSSTPAELASVIRLVERAACLIKPGSYSEYKLSWLLGRLQHRLGQHDDSLELLESAREGLDAQADAYDRSLLLLDLAELHLDRRDAASACRLAHPCFGVLSALHKDDEAFRAMRVFHLAASSTSLDRATVHSVRKRLLEVRRPPRRR